MQLIETNDLRYWAGTKASESRFPLLVKQLISAVIEPDMLRIPHGDATWLPGCDGVVLNQTESRYVPQGRSVWELGTSNDFRRKASRDYQKRSKDELITGSGKACEQSRVTFVFVTPFVWQDKDAWVNECEKDSPWNAIVVIDGVDLVDWFGDAPAVALQFAAEINRVPEAGLQTSEEAWQHWSHFTAPPLIEDIVIAGREEQQESLLSRLADAPSIFTVRGQSPREAWGFVLAVLRRIESESDRENFNARLIVADDESVAARLRNRKNLIILLKQAHGAVSGALSSNGSHVIVSEGNEIRSSSSVIGLPRPTRRQFTDALGTMDLDAGEPERWARECGLSVTILQRQRAHASHDRPTWAKPDSAEELLPALFAGRGMRAMNLIVTSCVNWPI